MSNRNINPIQTDRLTLVPIKKDFVDDLFANFNESISVYMYPAVPESISETEAFVENEIEKNLQGIDQQMIITDHQGQFLGCAALHKINTRTPEFGIWLKQSTHGKGYGKEAIAALKFWADENVEYDYLSYPVDKRNIASRKVAESIGGVASTEYNSETPDGRVLHIIEYRVYPNQ